MIKNKEKKYITLKEASKISGYAPDYVGQLIRKGKVDGEKRYYNVAWVTTEESLRAYMNKNTESSSDNWFTALIPSIFNKLIYLTLFILVGVSVFVFFIFSISIDQKLHDITIKQVQPEQKY